MDTVKPLEMSQYLQSPVLSPNKLWKLACNQSRVAKVEFEKRREKDEIVMVNNKTKCAHIPCLCDVRPGEEYCWEACRFAGREDVEIACQCDHLACPLVTRQSAPFGRAGLIN